MIARGLVAVEFNDVLEIIKFIIIKILIGALALCSFILILYVISRLLTIVLGICIIILLFAIGYAITDV